MSFDIRLPQISGTDREMLMQIRSYLYQLAPQLQWALENVNKRQETFSSSDPQRSLAKSVVSSGASNLSPQETFASIKALIIKSAEIVEAYSEEISRRLEGEYVAESDFGTFAENTSLDIYENSTHIDASFTNIQEIKTGVNSSIDELNGAVSQVSSKVGEVETNLSGTIKNLLADVEATNTYLKEIQAAIKIGQIKDGVYGIEVGQKITEDDEEVYNKFARFTADRLSFYDKNSIEVAYISDYKLYICNVEITESFQEGGYVDTVQEDGGVITQWVGRG